MKMTDSEKDLRLRAQSSRTARYRQWRNWRTGVIIESIHQPGEITEDYWDREFQAVVLFHHPEQYIVFCDPLEEALKSLPRHSGCRVVNLYEYNSLLAEYGGENKHGQDFYKTKPSLTLEALLAINISVRQEFSALCKTSE